MCVGLATRVKTLRLPEDVIETIEQFPGDNFTDKFVAAARLLGRDREKLVKQLDNLEHDRQQKLARIADMGKFTSKYSYLQQQLKDIGWRMSAIENKSRELLKAYDEVFGADSSNSTL